MKIAVASLNMVWEDKEKNKIKCEALINQTETYGCEAIIFPEMTLTGFSMNAGAVAESLETSETIRWFNAQARKFKLHIIFGVALQTATRPTNNLIVSSPEGEISANYAKIHPFSYSGEDKFFESGSELCSSIINNVSFGYTICYDLRFPEIFQVLSRQCKVIVTIANWPAKRTTHWEVLLKARAIENQSFVVGVNRVGMDGNGIEYIKNSSVINPNGEKKSSVQLSEELDCYNLDIAEADNLRNAFPVKADRKNDFYRAIL